MCIQLIIIASLSDLNLDAIGRDQSIAGPLRLDTAKVITGELNVDFHASRLC